MNRSFLGACAIFAVASSISASGAEAQNCAWNGSALTWGIDGPLYQVWNLSGVTAIAGGGGDSLALRSDGTVWGWGLNQYGALGDGTTNPRPWVGQVQTLADVIAIAYGLGFSFAVRKDGTVWAWGSNVDGQLGDGTTIDRHLPVMVQGLSDAVAVAAGDSHALALKSDGTVWGWGTNNIGQLGDGTGGNIRKTPVQVSISGVKAIAAGTQFSLALKTDGTVWAWGLNDKGQLGDGTTQSRLLPVEVLNKSGITAIAAGDAHGMALQRELVVRHGTIVFVYFIGLVWAWGANNFGQLGDGTMLDHNVPAPVQNLNSVTAISAGNGYGLAIKSDCTLWGWGFNMYGQLGDGTFNNRSLPVKVKNLIEVTAVSAGYNEGLAIAAHAGLVPSIIGLTTVEATAVITAAGLTSFGGTPVFNCDKAGKVLSQSPTAGTQLSPGASVSFTVGSLRDPNNPRRVCN